MVERLMEVQAAKSTEKQYKIMQGPETMKVTMNHWESTTFEKNFAFYASGECHDDDDVCE
jgi:hypothetical protein